MVFCRLLSIDSIYLVEKEIVIVGNKYFQLIRQVSSATIFVTVQTLNTTHYMSYFQ